MEFIFGTVERDGVTVENLKTVGEAHSHLEGFIQVVQEYTDSTITDRCRVQEHYRSEEDGAGGFYDWYIITDHYRYIDRTKTLAGAKEASAIAFVTLAESGSIDDVTAGEHKELFEEWKADVDYSVGQYRNHGDKLYRCIQPHKSQAGWEPDAATSLWVVAADPAEEWPAWSQPVGADDAYPKGARVTHNGKRWTSDVAANTWEPGVAMWTEVAA